MFWIGLGILAAAGAVAAVGLVAARRARLRQFDREALSTVGVARYRYVADGDGFYHHRPELRERTIARRRREEAARRHANRVATSDAKLEAVDDRKRA